MSSNSARSFSYNKHAEHRDRTSFGKLRSKYWTTKQLVIKKLGREEDEFIIASDADVDAKLELLCTIKQSCIDLLRIMDRYQSDVLLLSHDETDMARFLKDYAQMDRTRAGKMMASVSKVLANNAQQRLTLRQPLLRLHNEIETFSRRAVTDTLITVKRMETARTAYRGSILWLKDASVQLDPEKQLEKFRCVQNQVKSTKTEYERLKFDVIQKIDLLTASRCNMYSHVLATYQKTLLAFWAKTSKTMSAIAESFKGYQYYEFTVIKDLAEPSRLLAEMNSSSFTEKSKDNENASKKKVNEETNTEDTLIDLNESNENQSEKKLIKSNLTAQNNLFSDQTDPFSALIDISDAQLDDQLLELEKLTTIDQTTPISANNENASTASDENDNLLNLLDSTTDHEKLFSEILSSNLPMTNSGNNDLLGMTNTDSFEADWTAAFGNTSNQQVPSNSTSLISDQSAMNSTQNTFLPSSLLSEFLTSTHKEVSSTISSFNETKTKNDSNSKKINDKANWLDLFAELDPIQNPDAIGKSAGDEADRNC